MSTNAQEIYKKIVSNLSPNERLRLANLILNDLVEQNLSVIDYSDTWTEQDQLDLASFSLQYASAVFPDSEEIGE
jgi:ribose 5-phosphate isomerase RpiB